MIVFVCRTYMGLLQVKRLLYLLQLWCTLIFKFYTCKFSHSHTTTAANHTYLWFFDDIPPLWSAWQGRPSPPKNTATLCCTRRVHDINLTFWSSHIMDRFHISSRCVFETIPGSVTWDLFGWTWGALNTYSELAQYRIHSASLYLSKGYVPSRKTISF